MEQLLGADDRDVGMAPGQHGVARVAGAAAGGSCSHWSAAAKAIAALERPEPGGPVKSQAWLMPCPPAAAPQRLDRRGADPTRASQTAEVPLPRSCVIAAGLTEQRLDRAAQTWPRSRRPAAGVEHEVVLGVGRRQLQEAVAHALVELRRLALDPVAAVEAAKPCAGSTSSTTVRWGRRSRGRPAGDALDVGDVEGSRPAPW